MRTPKNWNRVSPGNLARVSNLWPAPPPKPRSFVCEGRVDVRCFEEIRRTSEMVPQHDYSDSSGNSHSTETLFEFHAYTWEDIYVSAPVVSWLHSSNPQSASIIRNWDVSATVSHGFLICYDLFFKEIRCSERKTLLLGQVTMSRISTSLEPATRLCGAVSVVSIHAHRRTGAFIGFSRSQSDRDGFFGNCGAAGEDRWPSGDRGACWPCFFGFSWSWRRDSGILVSNKTYMRFVMYIDLLQMFVGLHTKFLLISCPCVAWECTRVFADEVYVVLFQLKNVGSADSTYLIWSLSILQWRRDELHPIGFVTLDLVRDIFCFLRSALYPLRTQWITCYALIEVDVLQRAQEPSDNLECLWKKQFSNLLANEIYPLARMEIIDWENSHMSIEPIHHF